jgi:glyoxylate utilization-related uncharacterized protein
MKPRDIRDLVWFADDEARHETLFESTHLWSQVVCLQGAQSIGPMTDVDADAIVTVLAGEVAAQIGKARARMGQWGSALVEHGEELTLRNASEEPAVVLLVLAPPPAPAV